MNFKIELFWEKNNGLTCLCIQTIINTVTVYYQGDVLICLSTYMYIIGVCVVTFISSSLFTTMLYVAIYIEFHTHLSSHTFPKGRNAPQNMRLNIYPAGVYLLTFKNITQYQQFQNPLFHPPPLFFWMFKAMYKDVWYWFKLFSWSYEYSRW